MKSKVLFQKMKTQMNISRNKDQRKILPFQRRHASHLRVVCVQIDFVS